MTNVQALDTANASARKSVIETLERALAEARAGDVLAVALVVLRPKKIVGTAWSDGEVCAMAGGVALLQKRLLDEV